MSVLTRLLRGVTAGVMSLGAMTLAMSALALLRDGRVADWVPNFPSSPATVIAGLGAFIGGAMARRRLRHLLPPPARQPIETSKPTALPGGLTE